MVGLNYGWLFCTVRTYVRCANNGWLVRTNGLLKFDSISSAKRWRRIKPTPVHRVSTPPNSDFGPPCPRLGPRLWAKQNGGPTKGFHTSGPVLFWQLKKCPPPPPAQHSRPRLPLSVHERAPLTTHDLGAFGHILCMHLHLSRLRKDVGNPVDNEPSTSARAPGHHRHTRYDTSATHWRKSLMAHLQMQPMQSLEPVFVWAAIVETTGALEEIPDTKCNVLNMWSLWRVWDKCGRNCGPARNGRTWTNIGHPCYRGCR